MKLIPSKKNIIFVYSALVVLIILYLLSFVNFGKTNKKPLSIKFLNENELNSITGVQIYNYEQGIFLNNENNIWTVSTDENPENRIPVDLSKLNKLISALGKTSTLYKISDKIQNDTSYGLNDGTESVIRIYFSSGEHTDFVFGNTDFSQANRYFTTNPFKTVYLIDNSFDVYLNPSIQSWSDPFIVSNQLKNNVFKMGEVQSVTLSDLNGNIINHLNSSYEGWTDSINKLLELRHGGLSEEKYVFTSYDNNQLEVSIYLEMGDTSEIFMDIYNIPENDQNYLVHLIFNSNRLNRTFSYTVKISSWTYNKIKEITL